jgi:hypothetical protein
MVIAIITGALYNAGQGKSPDPRSDRQPEQASPQEAQMEFVRKNKTFLILPVAFSILIVIGLLTS